VADDDEIISAVAGLRADGPHHVRLLLETSSLSKRLTKIAYWLIDWQIPHSIRLFPMRDFETCVVEFRFPNEKHARAFRHEFQIEAIEDVSD
jgi:hypothetical protein